MLESWYPSAEAGDKKGLVLVVTAAKEGAITGGKDFMNVSALGIVCPGGCGLRQQGVGQSKLRTTHAEGLAANAGFVLALIMHFWVPLPATCPPCLIAESG